MSKKIEGMQDPRLQEYIDRHEWPHVRAMRRHVVEQLHAAVTNSLDNPAIPDEQIEVATQVLGQVALGEIGVKETL